MEKRDKKKVGMGALVFLLIIGFLSGLLIGIGIGDDDNQQTEVLFNHALERCKIYWCESFELCGKDKLEELIIDNECRQVISDYRGEITEDDLE